MALVLGLSGCGDAGEGKVVATVGKSSITRGTLNHWISTVLGGDYHQIIGEVAPVGLASDPPNYPACVSAARRVVPKVAGKPKLSATELDTKCHQLYVAAKEQALSYLIAALWRAEEGNELHTPVSDREVARKLQQIRYEEYKSPAAFNRYLAERHWTVGDELYLLKRNLLDTKFVARLKAQSAKLGGEQAFVKLVHENVAKWTSKTSCTPGYRAWQCKQYKGSEASEHSPSVLLEELHAGGKIK